MRKRISVAMAITLVSFVGLRIGRGESGDTSIRLEGGLAKDVRIVQVLDFRELEKHGWTPDGEGEVPMSPRAAIAIADKFCHTKLNGKVGPVLRELKLVSINVTKVRRWYWLAVYTSMDATEQIKGTGGLVALPISFSGHVMAEIFDVSK